MNFRKIQIQTKHLNLIKWHLLCHSTRHFFSVGAVLLLNVFTLYTGKEDALNRFCSCRSFKALKRLHEVRGLKTLVWANIVSALDYTLKRLHIFFSKIIWTTGLKICMKKKSQFIFISWLNWSIAVYAYHDFIWFGLISDVEIFMGRRHQSNKMLKTEIRNPTSFRLKQREWIVTNYFYASSLLSQITFKSLL